MTKHVQDAAHVAYNFYDDTEADVRGFCSMIDGGGHTHQVDVQQTRHGDFRWRLFSGSRSEQSVLVDGDLEQSMDEACVAAFKAYVTHVTGR